MTSQQLSLADGTGIRITDDGDAAVVVVLDRPGAVLRLVASERLELARQLVPPGWQVVPVDVADPDWSPGPSTNEVGRGAL